MIAKGVSRQCRTHSRWYEAAIDVFFDLEICLNRDQKGQKESFRKSIHSRPR